MSDIHVLSGHGDRWEVVMHIPIPISGTNVAGVDHRTALVASGRNTTQLTVGEVNPWDITAAEKALIDSGAVYEATRSFNIYESGATNAARIVALKAFYANVKGDIFNKLEKGLRYFGYSTDVA